MVSNKNKNTVGRDAGAGSGSGFRLNVNALKASPVAFVNGIRARSKEAAELSYSERTDLSSLINIHVNKNLKPSAFASLVSSISIVKQNSKNWDCTNVLNVLADSIPTRSEKYTSQEISMIFVAFARLQASYDKTLSRNMEFLLKVACVLPEMNERGVGDVLWGLGSMGAKWHSLPSQLQNALILAISTRASAFRFDGQTNSKQHRVVELPSFPPLSPVLTHFRPSCGPWRRWEQSGLNYLVRTLLLFVHARARTSFI